MGDKLLPDAAVKAIQDSVKVETLTIGGVEYTTREVHDPRTPEPTVTPLEINTLQGIVDYLTSMDEAEGPVVHVLSESKVRVITPATGYFKQRNTFVSATCEPVLGTSFSFGSYVDTESFNVALQSLFVMTDELENVLRVVGNIKEEQVKTVVDDGTTQTVTARAGIAKIEEVSVPNPVTLQPYRTFREIEQPASQFVLRMRSGQSGQKPTCALFEADGGKWKLTAIERIKEWLSGKLDVTNATIIA